MRSIEARTLVQSFEHPPGATVEGSVMLNDVAPAGSISITDPEGRFVPMKVIRTTGSPWYADAGANESISGGFVPTVNWTPFDGLPTEFRTVIVCIPSTGGSL